MKLFITIILISIAGLSSMAQVTLFNSGGTHIKLMDSTVLVVEDLVNEGGITSGTSQIDIYGNWDNQGTFNPDESVVNMTGNSMQNMNHLGAFYHLIIHNPAGVTLQNSIHVEGQIEFQQGDLITGLDHEVTLSEHARLINENANGYLIGQVAITKSIVELSDSTGNIGVVIQPQGQHLGQVTIRRVAGLETEGESFATMQGEQVFESIDRIYTIESEISPQQELELTFLWNASNNNSIGDLSEMQVWHEHEQWQTIGSVQDGNDYQIGATTNLVGRFTIGPQVLERPEVWIPTGFTPDADGKNDVWEIPGLEAYPKAVVTVYDRHGRRVFETKSGEFWDGQFNGQDSPTGTYFYIIELGEGQEKLNGEVSIIRMH